VLTKEAIGSATSFGREMRVHGNELIFARGDRSVDLFLVLDCEIVIYESGPEGKECEVASVRSGQFTDELDYSAKSHSIYFRATFGRQRERPFCLRLPRSLQNTLRSPAIHRRNIAPCHFARDLEIWRQDQAGANYRIPGTASPLVPGTIWIDNWSCGRN
jgi:hypothetical protein